MDKLRRPSTLAAAFSIGSVVWVLATNWDPVVHGHPSFLIFYLTLFLVSGVVLVRSLRPGPRRVRTWVSMTSAVGLALVGLLGLWLSPFGAEPVALEVLDDRGSLEVSETRTEVVLWPAEGDPNVGIIFYPGARVDARAYARVLRPLAEAGSAVVVAKAPLGIAFLTAGFFEGWVQEHPEIEDWIVAGHSLGGVAASSAARSVLIDGLLLWASFPASDISEVGSLEVVSVYGTSDAIAEPEEILASAGDLPETTRFVPVEGGIHSFFGDYGLQPGDGRPGTDRTTAQDQIATASMSLIEQVRGP